MVRYLVIESQSTIMCSEFSELEQKIKSYFLRDKCYHAHVSKLSEFRAKTYGVSKLNTWENISSYLNEK